jgi:DnaJ-class molecular chaperone
MAEETKEECPKCHGTGIVKEKNGTMHTCWDCLKKGKLNVHSEKVPDSKIKI